MTKHLTFYVWENRSGDINIHEDWDSLFHNEDWDYFDSAEDLADIGILEEYSLESKNIKDLMSTLASNRLVYKLKGKDTYYDIGSIYELEDQGVTLSDIEALYVRRPLFISEADQAEEKMSNVSIQDIMELLDDPTITIPYFRTMEGGLSELQKSYIYSDVTSGDWLENRLYFPPGLNINILKEALNEFIEWDNWEDKERLSQPEEEWINYKKELITSIINKYQKEDVIAQ